MFCLRLFVGEFVFLSDEAVDGFSGTKKRFAVGQETIDRLDCGVDLNPHCQFKHLCVNYDRPME